jgi:hypothetical protein
VCGGAKRSDKRKVLIVDKMAASLERLPTYYGVSALKYIICSFSFQLFQTSNFSQKHTQTNKLSLVYGLIIIIFILETRPSYELDENHNWANNYL